jgi:O-antigen/teichoic acid export membrane protein
MPARQADANLFAANVSRRTRDYDTLLPLAAVQVVGVICGVIGVRWSSSVIPPELLGVYGVLLSMVQLAPVVTHHGFVKHVQSHWTAMLQPRGYVRLLFHAAGRPTCWLIVALVFVLLILKTISGVPFSGALIAWLVVVNLLAVAAIAAQSALQAETRYWTAFLLSSTGSITRSFLPPLFATVAGATLFWLSTGFLLHAIAPVAFAALLLGLHWHRPGMIPPEAAASLRPTVRAFAGVGIFAWLAAAAPRWLAAAALTPADVGYFILAANLSLVVPATFGAIAFNYSFPKLFASARGGADNRTLLRSTHGTVAVVMIGSQVGLILLLLIAPMLLGVVIDVRYAEAVGWLLATGGAALAATTTQFYHNLLLTRKLEADCLRLSVFSSALRIALMAAGCSLSMDAFHVSLIALPWATVAFEAWYSHRRLPVGRRAS